MDITDMTVYTVGDSWTDALNGPRFSDFHEAQTYRYSYRPEAMLFTATARIDLDTMEVF